LTTTQPADLTNRYERKSQQWAWVGQQEDLQILVGKMRDATGVASRKALDDLTARLDAELAREQQSRAEIEDAEAADRFTYGIPWTSWDKPGLERKIAEQRTKMLGRATWNRGTDETEGDAADVVESIDPGVQGTLTLAVWEDASSDKPTIRVIFRGRSEGLLGIESTIHHSDLIAGSGLTDRMNQALVLQRPWWAIFRSGKGHAVLYVLAVIVGFLFFAPVLRLTGEKVGQYLWPVLTSIFASVVVLNSRFNNWLFPAFVMENRLGRSSMRVAWSVGVIIVVPLLSFGILFLLPPPKDSAHCFAPTGQPLHWSFRRGHLRPVSTASTRVGSKRLTLRAVGRSSTAGSTCSAMPR